MMYAVEYYAAPKTFIAQYELGGNDFIKNRNLLKRYKNNSQRV